MAGEADSIVAKDGTCPRHQLDPSQLTNSVPARPDFRLQYVAARSGSLRSDCPSGDDAEPLQRRGYRRTSANRKPSGGLDLGRILRAKAIVGRTAAHGMRTRRRSGVTSPAPGGHRRSHAFPAGPPPSRASAEAPSEQERCRKRPGPLPSGPRDELWRLEPACSSAASQPLADPAPRVR